jgi:multidrug efflux system membrane fusion protein
MALGALALLALAGCSGGAKRPAARFPVTVARVQDRAMPEEIISTGTIEPRQTVAVGSQTGGLIVRLGFHEGDDVEEGQLLFQIDPAPLQAAVEQAKAVLMKDQAQAVSAVADAERAQVLVPQNLISAQEADAKRAAAAALVAQVRADSAALLTARLNLAYASIRAPVAGRTGALMVHKGDYVKPNTADPLVTINTIRPILARFTVPEREMTRVLERHETPLETRVSPVSRDSTWLTGKLVFVDNAVDRSTGTLLVKAEFPNSDGTLWPGEFVNVRLILGVEPHATVVPLPAVTASQSGTIVYVMNPDSTVDVRPVQVARTLDEMAVIANGVHPGELVVTDGQMRLAPGARVLVRQPGAARSAPAGASGTAFK